MRHLAVLASVGLAVSGCWGDGGALDDTEGFSAPESMAPDRVAPEEWGSREPFAARGDPMASGVILEIGDLPSDYEGPARLRGDLRIEGGKTTLCHLLRPDQGQGQACLSVEGMALTDFPGLAKTEQGHWWPFAVLEGEVTLDGRFVDARLPEMLRLDLDGARINFGLYQHDNFSNASTSKLVARGEQVFIETIFGTPGSTTLVTEGGTTIELEEPGPCPPGAGCISGLILDTTTVEEGTYLPEEPSEPLPGLPPFQLTVSVEENPARWPPVGYGTPSHSEYSTGFAPPRE